MELKSWQLIGIIVGAVVVVVAIDIATRQEFQEMFPQLSTARFAKFRAPEMIAQEMTAPVFNSAPTFAEEDAPVDEDA